MQKGADPNKQKDDGLSALHRAAMQNSISAIRVLLQQGASTNIKTNYGYTPLDYARMEHNEEALRLLK